MIVLMMLLSSACGIIGGSKGSSLTDFCDRARSAEAAGVLQGLDGTETSEQLRAYETAQADVDFLADSGPARTDQPAKDFVAAYDELVTELKAADFDAAGIDAATLTDLNERLTTARAAMDEVFTGPCDLTATP